MNTRHSVVIVCILIAVGLFHSVIKFFYLWLLPQHNFTNPFIDRFFYLVSSQVFSVSPKVNRSVTSLKVIKSDSSSNKLRDKIMSLLSSRFLEECTIGRRSCPTRLKNPTVAGGWLVETQIY